MESIVENKYSHGLQHLMNNMLHPAIGKLRTYTQLSTGRVPQQDEMIWTNNLANEFGRLEDIMDVIMPYGTNMIKLKRMVCPWGGISRTEKLCVTYKSIK